MIGEMAADVLDVMLEELIDNVDNCMKAYRREHQQYEAEQITNVVSNPSNGA